MKLIIVNDNYDIIILTKETFQGLFVGYGRFISMCGLYVNIRIYFTFYKGMITPCYCKLPPVFPPVNS